MGSIPFSIELEYGGGLMERVQGHPDYPLRFVTAASLFDGHDAAINIMRRILQANGVEVIHLGHNRSVDEIVKAAIQEDVDAIAISSYQGGHNEFFAYCIDQLKENQVPHIQVFGGGGGTITPAEIKALQEKGVSRIYSPEDGHQMGLQGIILDMISRCHRKKPQNSPPDWVHLAKKSADLARVLTRIERGEDLPSLTASTAEKGIVVGMTGTGGAGKSSLTDELTLRLLDSEPHCRIGILAIDPTRKKTGGALLGDRLRINSLQNPRVFMRSIATRQSHSSISPFTVAMVKVMRRAGFDWIFVETGGIGQADAAIVEMVDFSIYVMTCEFGAPTQLEKINMLDFADLIIINKFDKQGALDALTEVRRQFRRNHREFEKLPPERFPVFGTIASRFGDPGIDAASQHLRSLATHRKRYQPLTENYTPGSARVFIPHPREHYLAEIASLVRDYHRWADEQVSHVARIEALERALESVPNPAAQAAIRSTLSNLKDALLPETRKSLEDFERASSQYGNREVSFQIRDKQLTVPQLRESLSHLLIPRVALPRFVSKADLMHYILRENLPGYFPYTGGVFQFKRDEEDPKRQFAGEGTPARTNRRFHLLCQNEKAKRLSTAFDSVTLYGEDPDHPPDIFGKIGESGVSVCTLDDAKILYSGFDLCDPNTSVSMTINGPAPMLLAYFFNTAIDQQVQHFAKANKRSPHTEEYARIRKDTLGCVRGTVQADILKEDQAQNTCIFSTEFALKMMGDIQQYFIDYGVRNYYSVSISGYHIAEAGANPISQVAFTLANAFTYVEYYRARGMAIDAFAPNFSFFFSNGLDPEYTVIGRVARRIWSIGMKNGYRASARSQKLKYHVQTSGRSLHAQEISFNDIRTTLQALIAYFDHCNSLHTNAYDEAVTTPTEESVRRAMAIQLIISKEFGWAKNENPLQGSFLVSELTDLVEEAVLKEFEKLSQRGGVLGAMESHYQRSRIQEESLYYEGLKHSGELPIVGVNTFINPHESFSELSTDRLTRASYAEKQEQIDRLREFHRTHESVAPRLLARLKETVRSGGNIFSELMETAKACSLGQISRALYETGGKYRRGV